MYYDEKSEFNGIVKIAIYLLNLKKINLLKLV